MEGAGFSVPSGDGKANGNVPAPQAPAPEVGPAPAAAPPVPSPSDEEWNLSIGGMHCASCVARVEDAVAAVPGVQDARVNLATERATVVVQPGRVDLDRLIESVGKAGYTARRNQLSFGAETATAIRRERDEQVGLWRRRLQVGIAVVIPLVLLGLGSMFVPALGNTPWVAWWMFALATVLQVTWAGRTFEAPGSGCSRDRRTWIR